MDDGQENESWKDAVASRLDTYRSRSNRKLSGEFSMRFDFDGEPAPPRQQICVPDLPEEPDDPVLEAEPLVDDGGQRIEQDPKPTPAQLELPQATSPPQPQPLQPSVPFRRKVVMEANVIEFPRLFPAIPQPPYPLGEPVLPSAPRILDAPEIGQPLLETPMIDGMRLEHLEREQVPEFELPLQGATVAQRGYAALFDATIVLIASGIFAAIVYKMMPGLEWTKPLLGSAMLVPAVLWALYEFLFIVYGARTPGMAITHLALSTFKGTPPGRRERRMRILGLVLSCSSLMLGFIWAFFDEDTLCWHDRISRTYLVHQD